MQIKVATDLEKGLRIREVYKTPDF